MARSNSFTFSLNRDQLITRAFQLVNIYQTTDTPGADDITMANIILNSMIKSWEADGVQLWKRKIGYLFTSYQTASYNLGSTGDNATTSYVSTTLSANAAAGATTLSLTSTAGMTVGDHIGIKLSDGTRSWTTILTVASSTSVTIPALSGAATSGNTVLSYTTKLNRPLRILNSNYINLTNSQLTESQMAAISHDDYFFTPVKNTNGVPTNFYYDKQLDSGVLYLFPRPNNVDIILKFEYQEPIMDMNTSTQDFDFPQEWLYALLYNLAVELAYVYGKTQEIQAHEMKARQLKEALKDFDSDTENLQIDLDL